MSLFDRPVYRAERDHQWTVMENSRAGRLWIVLAVFMLLPALLTSVFSFLSVTVFNQPLSVLPAPSRTNPLDWLPDIQLLMVVMNVALYFVIALVASALAGASIDRERRGGTWDLLRLTLISPQDLVLGKWLASLRVMRTDYLLLAVLRVGWAVWFAAGFHAQFPPDALSPALASSLLVLLALAFTLIDAAFTTALSIAIAVAEPARAGGAVSLAVRGMTLLVTVWAWGQIIARLFDSPGPLFFWHGVIYLVIYAVLTLAVLFQARRHAIRTGYVPGHGITDAD